MRRSAPAHPTSPDLAERVLELPVSEISALRASIVFVDGTAVLRVEPGPDVLGAIIGCTVPHAGCEAVIQIVLTARHEDAAITVTSPEGDVQYAQASVAHRLAPQVVTLGVADAPEQLSIRFRNGLAQAPTELRVHQLRVLLTRKAAGARAWLRQRILAELPPGLDIDTPSEELALALCDWGYRHIPRAHHWCVLDHDPEFWPFTFAPGEPLRRLLSMEAGVFCGGTANAMVAVYRIFGFDAYAVDCGWSESYLTHVMNLVRVPGAARMLTLCSYFNAALWQGDRLANLADALRALGQDARAECEFRTIRAESRKPFLVQRRFVDDLVELADPVFEYALLWERDGVCCFSSRYNLDNDETTPRLNPQLEEAFGAVGLQLILRRFIAVTDGPEAESLIRTLTAARDTPDAIPAWLPRVHAPHAILLAPSLLEPC